MQMRRPKPFVNPYYVPSIVENVLSHPGLSWETLRAVHTLHALCEAWIWCKHMGSFLTKTLVWFFNAAFWVSAALLAQMFFGMSISQQMLLLLILVSLTAVGIGLVWATRRFLLSRMGWTTERMYQTLGILDEDEAEEGEAS